MAINIQAPFPARLLRYIENIVEWTTTESYLTGDLIRVGNEPFIAVQNSTGIDPTTDTDHSHWAPFVGANLDSDVLRLYDANESYNAGDKVFFEIPANSFRSDTSGFSQTQPPVTVRGLFEALVAVPAMADGSNQPLVQRPAEASLDAWSETETYTVGNEVNFNGFVWVARNTVGPVAAAQNPSVDTVNWRVPGHVGASWGIAREAGPIEFSVDHQYAAGLDVFRLLGNDINHFTLNERVLAFRTPRTVTRATDPFDDNGTPDNTRLERPEIQTLGNPKTVNAPYILSSEDLSVNENLELGHLFSASSAEPATSWVATERYHRGALVIFENSLYRLRGDFLNEDANSVDLGKVSAVTPALDPDWILINDPIAFAPDVTLPAIQNDLILDFRPEGEDLGTRDVVTSIFSLDSDNRQLTLGIDNTANNPGVNVVLTNQQLMDAGWTANEPGRLNLTYVAGANDPNAVEGQLADLAIPFTVVSSAADADNVTLTVEVTQATFDDLLAIRANVTSLGLDGTTANVDFRWTQNGSLPTYEARAVAGPNTNFDTNSGANNFERIFTGDIEVENNGRPQADFFTPETTGLDTVRFNAQTRADYLTHLIDRQLLDTDRLGLTNQADLTTGVFTLMDPTTVAIGENAYIQLRGSRTGEEFGVYRATAESAAGATTFTIDLGQGFPITANQLTGDLSTSVTLEARLVVRWLGIQTVPEDVVRAAGTPVDDQWARWTNATTVEGVSNQTLADAIRNDLHLPPRDAFGIAYATLPREGTVTAGDYVIEVFIHESQTASVTDAVINYSGVAIATGQTLNTGVNELTVTISAPDAAIISANPGVHAFSITSASGPTTVFPIVGFIPQQTGFSTHYTDHDARDAVNVAYRNDISELSWVDAQDAPQRTHLLTEGDVRELIQGHRDNFVLPLQILNGDGTEIPSVAELNTLLSNEDAVRPQIRFVYEKSGAITDATEFALRFDGQHTIYRASAPDNFNAAQVTQFNDGVAEVVTINFDIPIALATPLSQIIANTPIQDNTVFDLLVSRPGGVESHTVLAGTFVGAGAPERIGGGIAAAAAGSVGWRELDTNPATQPRFDVGEPVAWVVGVAQESNTGNPAEELVVFDLDGPGNRLNSEAQLQSAHTVDNFPDVTDTFVGDIIILTQERDHRSSTYPTTGGLAVENIGRTTLGVAHRSSWPTTASTVLGPTDWTYTPSSVDSATTQLPTDNAGSGSFTNNSGSDQVLDNGRLDLDITVDSLPATGEVGLTVNAYTSDGTVVFEATHNATRTGRVVFNDITVNNNATIADGESLFITIDGDNAALNRPAVYTVNAVRLSFTQTAFEREIIRHTPGVYATLDGHTWTLYASHQATDQLPVVFTDNATNVTLAPRQQADTDLVSTFDRIVRATDQNIMNVDISRTFGDDGNGFDVNTGGRAELRFLFSLPQNADLSPGSSGARQVFVDFRDFNTIRQTGDANVLGTEVDITTFSTTVFSNPSTLGAFASALDNRVRAALNSVETSTTWRTVSANALVNGIASNGTTLTNAILPNATQFEIIVRSDNEVSPVTGATFNGNVTLTYQGNQEVEGVDGDTVRNTGARNTGPLTADFIYRPSDMTDDVTVRVATFTATQANINAAEIRGAIGAHGTTTPGLTVSDVPGTTNNRFVLDAPLTFDAAGANIVRLNFDGNTIDLPGVVTALDPYVTQTELARESDREIFRIAPATIFQGREVASGTTNLTIGGMAVALNYIHYNRRGADFFYYEDVQNDLGGVFKRGTVGLLDTEVIRTSDTTANLMNNESDSPDTNIFTLLG